MRADWNDASRTIRYCVGKQVLTVAAATVPDPDHTFPSLPSGKIVRVKIISANAAGRRSRAAPRRKSWGLKKARRAGIFVAGGH